MSENTPENTQTGAPADPSQVSAPGDSNKQDTSSQVDTGEKPQGQVSPPSPKEQSRIHFQKRQQEKRAKAQEHTSNLEAQIKKLSEQVEKLTVEPRGEEPATHSKPKPVENDSIEAVVDRKLKAREEDQAYMAGAVNAERWLLTRKGLQNDPNAVGEIGAIMNSRFSKAAGVDPEAAVQSAYVAWCATKGVAPDFEARTATPAHRVDDALPSASSGATTPSLPKQGMSKEQAAKYIAKHELGSKEWAKAYKEVEQAQKAGRIK